MAAANGTLTPPSLPPAPASPSAAKRKRSASANSLPNGSPADAPEKPVHPAPEPLSTVLESLLTVLKSYDTQPSILAHALSASLERTASGEADPKRTKLSPPEGSHSIIQSIQEGRYDSLEALEKDVESAIADILASIGANDLSGHVSRADSRLQTRLLAFQQALGDLVSREKARRTHFVEKTESVAQGTVPKEEQDNAANEESQDSRTVLTLFGSAQGPKQLFSSLQQPQRVGPVHGTKSELDLSVKVTLPLRESALPNIISTSEVQPVADEEEARKKKDATIGEIFRAPAHLAQISPPKPLKAHTTKGNTITFAPPETPRANRKSSQSYAHQNVATGVWLGYGGVDVPKDSTSPTAKQKSRQRALSTGEAQQPPSEGTLAAVRQAKEEALFRSAYSSFAPSRDNSTAIIPDETKTMVWWQKVGEKRFEETFPSQIDPALLAMDESSAMDDDDFKDVVDNFVPSEDGVPPDAQKDTAADPMEKLLEEVSSGLEMVASLQKIRNSSLTTNPRTPVIQNSSLASLAGSPSTPSQEEQNNYEMLKNCLVGIIKVLPPYLVAKLNGDQLADLNISRTIPIETKDYSGVLEEDQLSKAAKAPAAVAGAPPNLARMGSSGSAAHSHYPSGNTTQYSRSSQPIHSGSRPAQTPQSFYPPQQPVHRSPSVNYPRTSSSYSQGYQSSTQTYATTPRQSYPVTPGYGQQTSRPAYAAQPTPGQYHAQRPTQPTGYGTGPANSQYFQPTPQTQQHNRYAPQQSQNGYYQRPQNVPPMYGTASSPHARTSSPLKNNPAVTQGGYGSRPNYSTPVGQMRTSYYPSQYSAPQPSTPSTTAPAGLGASASSQQQLMLERQQQAQSIAQSQARLAAQNSFTNRQGSGTPQPSQNGNHNGQQQVNGGAMVT